MLWAWEYEEEGVVLFLKKKCAIRNHRALEIKNFKMILAQFPTPWEFLLHVPEQRSFISCLTAPREEKLTSGHRAILENIVRKFLC